MTTTAKNDVKIVTELTDDSKIVSSLAAAFANDPLYQFCFGASEKAAGKKSIDYTARLRILFEAYITIGLPKNCIIHTSVDEQCVAMWREEESRKEKDKIPLRILLAMFKCFRGRAFGFFRISTTLGNYHPKEPHVYLWMIGTVPERQGKGLGSQVMSKMLERCDREGLPAYLESSNEKSIPFYRRHGFEIMRVIPNCPKNCPPITAMWRKPRTSTKKSFQHSH